MGINKTLQTVKGDCMPESLASTLFKEIDFPSLQNAIDVLGDKSVNLSPEEKKNASKIVDEWAQNVIQNLHGYINHLGHVTDFLTSLDNEKKWFEPGFPPLSEEQITRIIDLTKTKELYEAALRSYEIEKEYTLEQKPAKPYIDDLMSKTESEILLCNYNTAKAKYEKNRIRLKRNTYKNFESFITKVNKAAEIRALIKETRRFQDSLKDKVSQCTQMALAARINIEIPVLEVRSAIQELIDFAKNIGHQV